jgi:hypothetical protein
MRPEHQNSPQYLRNKNNLNKSEARNHDVRNTHTTTKISLKASYFPRGGNLACNLFPQKMP